ncbi:uncharacterized protein LOC115698189 [Cannabis sativa]|uniref:uncharacterized protein LOC115698189 n=1 Tax=Cannabis sativa TaxID=3483 RepID=UPI0011E003B9|nr:uncharacterized protein LOC115698189 [Cannabis sativa]XP_060957728.1 uncharacterized protein LOC115698189 [Cannabis sativa]
MGKSIPWTTTSRIYQFSKTTSQIPGIADQSLKKKMEKEKETVSSSNDSRLPLSEVVSDCVKRWFKDTLKEAKTGDINMQVLVGQMYFSGYGVPRDAQRGRIWITRASRTRSFWKVSDKHPGYNASDSDSDELKGDS